MDLKSAADALIIRDKIDPTYGNFGSIQSETTRTLRAHVTEQVGFPYMEGPIEDILKETVNSWILKLKQLKTS